MADHIFENDDQIKWGTPDEKRERFLSWRQVTLQQFSYVMNLLLGFSTASIAFEISTKFPLGGWSKFSYLVSLWLLVAAVACGVFATFARLVHLQNTTWLARKRWDNSIDDSIECLNCRIRLFRKFAQWLFVGQAIFFGVGIAVAAFVYSEFIPG